MALLGFLSMTAQPAQAFDLLGTGIGTAVNGQVGVSTPINSTPLYAPMGGNIDAENRYIYQRDAKERTARQRALIQDTSVSPHDIAPAAGLYLRKPATVNMGGITSGFSYND